MLIHPFDAAPGTLRVSLGAVFVDPITGKYTELDLPSDPRWGYSLADHVALNQDGTRVAYSTTHSTSGEDVSEIWVMQLDGSDKQLVHREKGFLNLISWSPTGKQLLYFYQPRVEEFSSSELWLLNLDGSEKKLLTNRIRQASERRYRPAWSPDGRYIAVVQVDDVDKFLGDWREPGTNAYVINVTDGQSTKLSAFQGQNISFPIWSPDGGQVAFVSSPITGNPRTGIKPPYAEILIARLDGTQLHAVSNSAVWRSALAWLRPFSPK
jgi:Tol biopolymer transport system component